MGVRVREKVKGSREWWVFVHWKVRRFAKQVGDKRAAQAVASKLREELATQRLRLPLTGPTFSQLAEEWLTKYPVLRSIRPTTLENYRSFVQQHLLPCFGTMRVGDMTAQTVEDFIALKRGPDGSVRRRGRPLSEQSLRTGLIALRLILQRAVALKYLNANPAAGVGRFPRAEEEEQVDAFTGAELRATLSRAFEHDPDFGTFLRLWAQSGMRAGEVCGLRWEDLDLEQGHAIVRRTWTRQRIGPTKTGRTRVVSFLHPVADETVDWRPGATETARSILTGLRRLKVHSLDPEAFVFTRRGTPLTSWWLHQEWRRVLQGAKVRYRPAEQLRHTWASTLLSRNAPLLYVQRQGGWRSAAILLRVYARWLPEALDRTWQSDTEATGRTPDATAGSLAEQNSLISFR